MFCDLFSFIAVFLLKSEYHNKMHVSLGKFILTFSIIDIIILCKNKYMHSAAMLLIFSGLCTLTIWSSIHFPVFSNPAPCLVTDISAVIPGRIIHASFRPVKIFTVIWNKLEQFMREYKCYDMIRPAICHACMCGCWKKKSIPKL